MKNSIIVFILVAIVFIGGLIYFSGQKNNGNDGIDNNENAAPTSLAATEASYDFGSVSMAKGRVWHSFEIKNSGASPVTLTKLYTSCMCTTATLKTAAIERGPFGMPGHTAIPKINETLAAGEQATVNVEFDPAAHGPTGVGPVERSVYIETADGQILELKFNAAVTP